MTTMISPTQKYYFIYDFRALRDLHSFPTRRSSDLRVSYHRVGGIRQAAALLIGTDKHAAWVRPGLIAMVGDDERSEEHTSELQSRFDLVCRLLLEKKKKRTN